MKTTNLLLSAICFFTICNLQPVTSFAQGNLQFNQVINVSITAGTCGYTVPAGKVFKLEFASGGSDDVLKIGLACGSGYYLQMSFSNQGSKAGMNSVASGGVANGHPFPQWYKAGSVFYNWDPTGDSEIYINGIEFNVVP